MPVEQTRNCRVGDIILLLHKNEESKMITDIDPRGGVHLIRTTDLAGRSSRLDTHDGPNEVNVRGTQGALLR